MNPAIKKRLAQTLEIDPAEIMEYRQTADGTYTVLLTSYQKYNNVQPAPAPAPPKKQPPKPKQAQAKDDKK